MSVLSCTINPVYCSRMALVEGVLLGKTILLVKVSSVSCWSDSRPRVLTSYFSTFYCVSAEGGGGGALRVIHRQW